MGCRRGSIAVQRSSGLFYCYARFEGATPELSLRDCFELIVNCSLRT
jgi:hypothetical protein